MHITVWNEAFSNQKTPQDAARFPGSDPALFRSIFEAVPGAQVALATIDEPACGLPDALLQRTDVLVWWGHSRHEEVPDTLVDAIRQRVLGGMGLIVLHSGHLSKIFRSLMGTACNLSWRHDHAERLFCCMPGHPIAAGVPAQFDLGCEEVYSEPFGIPQPDELIFLGWFDSGHLFRSGCAWQRGYGRVFYFQPGHETNASLANPHVRRILQNACAWAAPGTTTSDLGCPHIEEENLFSPRR
ncbi:MAG: ThuA domain-containing protein [Oscillospiraceae bacterium]